MLIKLFFNINYCFTFFNFGLFTTFCWFGVSFDYGLGYILVRIRHR